MARAVLFDVGDTLWRYPGVDSDFLLQKYHEAWHLLGDSVALPAPERLVAAVSARLAEEREAFLTGRERGLQPPTAALVTEAMARLGASAPPDAVRAFTAAVFDAEAELAINDTPEPEHAAVLAELRSRGLRLGCVSNTFMSARGLWRLLEARRLDAYLEVVVSSADVGFRKPHAACFLPALKHLEVEPAEALFVGDRLDTDVEGALGLGMTAVLTHQYRREEPCGPVVPHHVIAHLGQLLTLVESLDGR